MVVLCAQVSAVVLRVVEGRVCGLPVMLPGGAVEARGSRVARQRHRGSDAAGALDPGGTAPQAARHHRRHLRTQHLVVLDARVPGAGCSGVKKGGGVLLGLSWRGRVACSRSVARGVDRPVGAAGHPFAAHGGMECCDRCGRTRSIKKDDVATGEWGHDRHDPRRPRVGVPAHAGMGVSRRMCPSRSP